MPVLPSLRISELPSFTGDISTLFFPANIGYPPETYIVPFSSIRTQILTESTVQGNLNILQNLSASGSFIIGKYNHQTQTTTFEGYTSNTTVSTLKPTTSLNFTLMPNSAYSYKILVTSYEINTNLANSFEFSGLVKRNASNNTTLVGYPTKIINAKEDVTTDVNVVANDSLDSLDIRVQGSAGSTYRWTATVNATIASA